MPRVERCCRRGPEQHHGAAVVLPGQHGAHGRRWCLQPEWWYDDDGDELHILRQRHHRDVRRLSSDRRWQPADRSVDVRGERRGGHRRQPGVLLERRERGPLDHPDRAARTGCRGQELRQQSGADDRLHVLDRLVVYRHGRTGDRRRGERGRSTARPVAGQRRSHTHPVPVERVAVGRHGAERRLHPGGRSAGGGPTVPARRPHSSGTRT